MTRQIKILLLTLLTLCEISCLLFARYGVGAATIIYTLSGIAMCIVSLGKDTKVHQTSADRYARYTYILYIAAILLIANWTMNIFRAHIYGTPLDQSMGDMLLYIREMAQRYMVHQHVYDPISDINGSNVRAVYLPAFWLPYTVPLYFDLDMRWASLFCFVSSILIVTIVRRKHFSGWHILLLLPLALFTCMILNGAAYYLMFTQEAVVLFYMALLCWALTYEYWIAAGMAAALCIMSRYFITAPLLGVVVWLFIMDRKAARKVTLATFITLMIILTVSRSWSDLAYFPRIPFLYMAMLNDTSSLEGFRYVMYYGSVGFASFLHGDCVRYITFVNIPFLALAPIAYFFFANRYLTDRKKGLILLCGIKIFLVLFLTTLSHPYGYVVYTASLVSIMLLRNVLILAAPMQPTLSA